MVGPCHGMSESANSQWLCLRHWGPLPTTVSHRQLRCFYVVDNYYATRKQRFFLVSSVLYQNNYLF
ncbi:hypothetical protein Hanom_Chr14g01253261 [Helianthus anomalus]